MCEEGGLSFLLLVGAFVQDATVVKELRFQCQGCARVLLKPANYSWLNAVDLIQLNYSTFRARA